MPAKNDADVENQSVERALKILSLLAERQEPLGVREITRRLGVAPSIAQRLIRTMANNGFVEQTDTTLRYLIGYKAFQIGNAFVGLNNLYSVVMPELYSFADRSVNGFPGVCRDQLCVSGDGAKQRPHRVDALAGRADLFALDRNGQSHAAEMSDEEMRTLLGRTPLPKLTAKTRISLSRLNQP